MIPNERSWLSSGKIWFKKQKGRPDVVHRLWFADPWFRELDLLKIGITSPQTEGPEQSLQDGSVIQKYDLWGQTQRHQAYLNSEKKSLRSTGASVIIESQPLRAFAAGINNLRAGFASFFIWSSQDHVSYTNANAQGISDFIESGMNLQSVSQ